MDHPVYSFLVHPVSSKQPLSNNAKKLILFVTEHSSGTPLPPLIHKTVFGFAQFSKISFYVSKILIWKVFPIKHLYMVNVPNLMPSYILD
jgi:hypothetical protein